MHMRRMRLVEHVQARMRPVVDEAYGVCLCTCACAGPYLEGDIEALWSASPGIHFHRLGHLHGHRVAKPWPSCLHGWQVIHHIQRHLAQLSLIAQLLLLLRHRASRLPGRGALRAHLTN